MEGKAEQWLDEVDEISNFFGITPKHALIFFIFASLVDIGTTYVGISFVAGFSESNPVMIEFMNHFGIIGGLVVAKTLLVILTHYITKIFPWGRDVILIIVFLVAGLSAFITSCFNMMIILGFT